MSKPKSNPKPKVMVAMSGGVDSSVAAALLLDQGYDVTAVTLKLWGGESDTGCCSVSDVNDARRVSDHLGIQHHVFNFGAEFNDRVVAPYVADHQIGQTPNPCVECNRHLKFDKLLKSAVALGFDLVATGHHARLARTSTGQLRLRRGVDAGKDQSYVLWMLNQAQLSRLLFPVGDLTKDEVRELARERGIRTAHKPDSQDVCFITKAQGRREFLSQRVEFTPAQVVALDGGELGEVDAVELVTLGQRRNLGLSGQQEPKYVVDVDVNRALVTVGEKEDLLCGTQPVAPVEWTGEPAAGKVRVQYRAHGKSAPGWVDETAAGGASKITWESPQPRIAPGQSVVFYDETDELVLGGTVATRRDSRVMVLAQ